MYGRVHNGEYYFNCGSLSGLFLMKQFLQVLTGYESASIKICSLVSDGGGNDAHLFKFLRGGREIPNKAWLSGELVTFVHQIFPERKIAIWLCSTHNQKACRNALHKSGSRGTRMLTFF